MKEDAHQKVQAHHLKRKAYLYIRQSTLRQVFENTESTKRQYALRQRAVALGWPAEEVVVIDSDLGQSGASTAEREGFQRLVADVGMGRAGIVMGLEVSRLARNSTDWHRLLEICALSDTLILDEDGVYDPAHFNDRLLLGLKGTMSEAELHVLRARLRGGILNKARRGELWSPVPIGFVYDAADRVVLDPDQQVQAAVRLLFQTFERVGTATATIKAFREGGIQFPRRAKWGPNKGELLWTELEHSQALRLLHNPRYAGAFFFGRTRQRKHADPQRGRFKKLAREDWTSLVKDAHPGYITWERYEANLAQLAENAAAHGVDRRKSPPREGPALLQGLAICGRCGQRMTIRYHQRNGQLVPSYVCQREGIQRGESPCQTIAGAGIDAAMGEMLVEVMTPMALEVALAVQDELQTQAAEADALRRQQVERARYEADLARRRYMQVDPGNRLVADVLEAEWNEKLRGVTAAQEAYEQQSKDDRALLDKQQQARILELSGQFPRLWRSPDTPDRERKRMARLLLEDVTLDKTARGITARVRFRGGRTRVVELARPRRAWELRQTPAAAVAEIDRLLDRHTYVEIAALLNEGGFKSGQQRQFHARMIQALCKQYRLVPLYDRLRATGYLTAEEMARELDVSVDTLKNWRLQGLVEGKAYTDRPDYVYPPLGESRPEKFKWKRARTGS